MFMKPSDIIGYWAGHAILGVRLDSVVAPPLDSGRLLIPHGFFLAVISWLELARYKTAQ